MSQKVFFIKKIKNWERSDALELLTTQITKNIALQLICALVAVHCTDRHVEDLR